MKRGVFRDYVMCILLLRIVCNNGFIMVRGAGPFDSLIAQVVWSSALRCLVLLAVDSFVPLISNINNGKKFNRKLRFHRHL